MPAEIIRLPNAEAERAEQFVRGYMSVETALDIVSDYMDTEAIRISQKGARDEASVTDDEELFLIAHKRIQIAQQDETAA